jgi:hypothetical protein
MFSSATARVHMPTMLMSAEDYLAVEARFTKLRNAKPDQWGMYLVRYVTKFITFANLILSV